MINTQILDEAAEWFVAVRDGEVGAVEREEFAGWLCRSPEHVRAYLELTSLWAEAAHVDAGRKVDAQALIARARAEGNVVSWEDRDARQPTSAMAALDSRSSATVTSDRAERTAATASLQKNTAERGASRRFSRRRRPLLFAACAVICIAISAGWWQLNRGTTYATGIGEQRSIRLADGSRVELNARSRIRIRFSASERFVELTEGQGLFQVAKDSNRPFVVRSDDARVRAVGTQFDVYRKASGTVVTVLEGRVEVRASEPSPALQIETLELAAGEQAVIAGDLIGRTPAANVAAATAWTQQQLVFEAATLAEVADEFNRYNLRQLVIRDARLEAFLISGVFSSADASSLLRFLQEQPGFTVQETAKEIRIARE